MLRSLALAVFLVFVTPAAAGAVVGERIIKYHDEAEGVSIVERDGKRFVRFDRGKVASKVWRRLSGRRLAVGCDRKDGAQGEYGVRQPGGRRIALPAHSTSTICTISTRNRNKQAACDYDDEFEDGFCVRVTVALDDAGRARVSEVVASLDLLVATSFANLDDIIENARGLVMRLANADATPPPGVIGVWQSGRDFGAVVLTMAGERRFISRVGAVTSTNAVDLLEPVLPSLLG